MPPALVQFRRRLTGPARPPHENPSSPEFADGILYLAAKRLPVRAGCPRTLAARRGDSGGRERMSVG